MTRLSRFFAWLLLALLCLPVAAQAKTVRVGLYHNPPKILIDAAGRPGGFFVELLDAVAAAEGWELEYVPCKWDTCLRQVESGEIDLMPDVAYSPARAERFAFNTHPVLLTWSEVYARPEAEIHTILDLDGMRVAVLAGSVQHAWLRRESKTYGIAPQIVEARDFDGVFGLVRDGQAEAGIVNRFYGTLHAERFGLKRTRVLLLPSRLHFIAAPGDPADLLSMLDRRLEQYKADKGSAYHHALERWLLPLDEIPLPAWVSWGASIFLLGMFSMLVLNRILARRLARGQASYQTLFKNTGTAMAVVGVEGRINLVNDEFARLSGVPVAEATGKHFTHFIVPEDRARIINYHQMRLAGDPNTPMQFSLDFVTAHGQRRTGLVTVGLVPDSHDTIASIIDITANRELEMRLDEAQKIGHLGYWELDLITEHLWWSEETYRIFELDPANKEISYATFIQTVHPDDREQVERGYRHSVEAHEPYDILHRLYMPDGRVKYVNERCQTFYDGHGKPLRSIGTIIDVTERWQSQQKLDAVLISTIQAMATALDKRDPYTSGHQQRVAALAESVGKQLGLENEQIQGLHLGAVIHNLGNLYVPMEILNRPGPLNDHEFAIVKSHPEVGYEIVKDIDFPWPVAEMVHQHHERLDGSGYPQGLSGESIILEARILAVADVVVAMTTHRPYRPARPLEQAMAELENGRGRLYDPAVVEACLAVLLNDDYQADLL